ncbi:flagellar protein FliO/FliZ [Clostridium cavendishii DSM 21758]|uniref:Flagellar protein FliO/FliZ n=1 Tax=Clostridium cavendishii DSM 21758 TaxID=1121302 RepID=A0A1M6AUM7_9CLOT|nr:flagellar biosynthetic protein FliO [Clostridium cavendishii]SHI39923.1 flagellar protein FliO/FliZ [Clostridium cavendishii DSM 21758]
MNTDLILTVVKLFFGMIILMFLIVLTLKLGANKVSKFQRGKYIKVLEKTPLSKDSNLFLIKLGEEGCIITSSQNNVEVIKKLTKDEIDIIEKEKKALNDEILNMYNNKFENLKNKLNIKK